MTIEKDLLAKDSEVEMVDAPIEVSGYRALNWWEYWIRPESALAPLPTAEPEEIIDPELASLAKRFAPIPPPRHQPVLPPINDPLFAEITFVTGTLWLCAMVALAMLIAKGAQ